MFEHGFKYNKDSRHLNTREFGSLISDKGQFYSISICFYKDEDTAQKVEILDSLKILNFKVEDVAKGFDLPIRKLEIDYDEKREIGHKLTTQEVDYLRNDVEIMSRALYILFLQELTQMTQGSNALHDYKKTVGKNFKRWFPVPTYDADIRQSYKGGFTYCNKRFQGKDISAGIVLDVNSLYPSVMYYCKLPHGEGVYFEGKYEKDDVYDLYVQMFSCQFDIKEGYIPTLQLKNNLSFVPTEYVEHSGDETITLCLTSVDLEIFMEHYDVVNIEWKGGWKFRSAVGMFKEYIDKWNTIKMESTLNGNKAMRTLAKLMMNALYGKFALNPKVCSKYPVYNEGKISYTLGDPELRKPIYIPMGTFITAWARHKTITSAQMMYDRFLYADTDSLHLIGTEIPEMLEVDPVKLGAWKHESTFSRARFLRAKSYVEEIEGELHITCAGMPAQCYKYVTWENFFTGSKYAGKLRPVHVPGGIVLEDTEFTLRE